MSIEVKPLPTVCNSKPLFIIIVCALFLQLFGFYFARHYLVFDHFMAMWPLLRVILPVLLLLALKIPLQNMAFRYPRFDKASTIMLAVLLLALGAVVVFFANFADHYLAYYRQGISIDVLRASSRFENFMVFTVSTVIAWEIFHRGFLLGAIRYCLQHNMAISKPAASHIALLFVACFESLFHLSKPIYESMPFIVASISLSWLTLRTRSLWPALLVHFMLEVIFGYSAYVGW